MWRNIVSPGAALTTPELDAGSWISDVQLFMACGSHQVAVITVMTNLQRAFPSQTWRTPAGALWNENTPVHLRYQWYADDPGDFFGYVASSQTLASENDARHANLTLVPVQYTCVGASMLMQSTTNRLWQDSTCSYMARTIAQDNGLLPWVQVTDQHFDQRMQASSDWSFLTDLATRCGYRLYLDGTTLGFVARSTALPSSDGSVPAFWMRKVPGVIDSLRSFSGVLGETDPAGGLRAKVTATSLNSQSGALATAVYTAPRTDRLGQAVPPLLTQRYSDLPAGSYADAESLLASTSTYLWVQANAVTNGDTRLKPGALVELRGDGISEAHQGLWMVQEAIHSLAIDHFTSRKSDYTTTLTLGRNSGSALVLPAQTMPAPVSYGSQLIGGRWRAVTVGSA